MARIQTEKRGGLECRFVQGYGGVRIYLLPNVPTDAGTIHSEESFDLEGAVEKFPDERRDRVRIIGEDYAGRQLDATSILLYAQEKDQFDSYAQRLEAKPDNFNYIHPELMTARTDVTAFFMRLYSDLGVAPEEEAARCERQLKDYGVGVVVVED